MAGNPRLHLGDHLRPGAHFYLERQRMTFPAGAGPVPPSGLPVAPVRHRHDFLEIFWVETGRGWEHRSDGVHALDPGRMVLLRADDTHSFSGLADDPLVIWNLAFPVADWRSLAERHAGELRDWFALPAAARRLRLRPQEARQLMVWAEDLAAGGRRRLDLERLLLDLAHLLGESPRTDAAVLPAWLAAAVTEVREPRWFVHGAAALVRLAGRSPEHVARSVRRHLGTTPTGVVNEARLTWAARRLADSDDSILATCLACGWQNLGCFYRSFRRRFGTSPGEWRRRAARIAGG
jgi:AraC family cel operon transcriptional repressor